MAVAKSPFKVYRDFLSPKLCEHFSDKIGFVDADYDHNTKKPLKMLKFDDEVQLAVYERLLSIVPDLEHHYGFKYKGTEQMMVEWLSEGVVSEPYCENSHYLRKKWVRTRDRDFTGILFMTDFQDQVPFDSDYEVYGGKLEFPQHQFGFNPERGTLVVFPSVPHFINANSKIQAGALYQVRFHITATEPYLYNPKNFPGDYRTWFANV